MTIGLFQMGDPNGVGKPVRNPSSLSLSQLRSLRWIYGSKTWYSEDSMTTYPHAESPEKWNLSSRLNEKDPIRVFKLRKKAMRHH